jgi:glutamate---cysteine ligase / carboxylate-amine ligase
VTAEPESPSPLHLFQAYGVEVEYMIVDSERLDVLPACDELIRAVAGAYESEVEMGELCWSNELVLHVVELKTNGPAPSLEPLGEAFAKGVARVNQELGALGGRLMPTAMHPWMDPERETRLWPHEYGEVYAAFDKIFGCSGHGWSNLQSVHLNLPFSGDEEFGRLHAAIRLVLPLIPALAASSPFVEGSRTGLCDTRLEYYRNNCRRIPSVTGRVIPERAFSRADYQREILDVIRRDVAPHDASGVLDPEWVNARGAIARFERDAIEIRLTDVQECPSADLAVVAAIAGLVRALAEARWCACDAQTRWPVERLEGAFHATLRRGGAALIEDREYLEALGLSGPSSLPATEVWCRVVDRLLKERLLAERAEWNAALELITTRGCLAQRLARATGDAPSRERLRDVYRALCEGLAENRPFEG